MTMCLYLEPLLTVLIAVWTCGVVTSEAIPCTGPGQCPVHSECALTARGGTCECTSGYFSTGVGGGGNCLKAIELAKPCRDYGQCGQNAECGVDRSGVCECKRGYYASGGVCKPAISLGEVCSPGEKCVNMAECVSGKCACSEGFYQYRGYCTKSRNVGEFCFSSDECTRNAQCSSDHVCVCGRGVANADGMCVI